MNFTEIIAAIQASGMDKAEEISKDLTNHVESLKTENDKQITKLSKQIENLATAAGIESGTTEERLAAASSAIKSLTEQKESLAAEKENLTQQIAKSQKQQLIANAASKSNASAAVLDKLIGDEEVKIEGDKVMVAGKPLKDWAEANHNPFMASLFPEASKTKLTNTSPHKTQEKGKDDSSKEKDDESKTASQKHVDRYYKKPSFVV